MTDDRPRPRYGEYAPIPVTPATPATPAAPPPPPSPAAAAAPARRTWDVVLTTALLLFGVVDVVRTFPQLLDLAPVLRQLYLDQGIGEFTSDTAAAQAGLVIGITRIVLLVITITVSLLLLSRHRIAFWVPLTGGALGVLVIIAALGMGPEWQNSR